MNQSRRLLPPVSALASLVAAARHGSFSRAGTEVGLTQSAISRQIASSRNGFSFPCFIATLPSFSMRWLAPRLPHLTARHPEIVVNFAARSHPFLFSEEPFDAAIHFGFPEEWPGTVCDFLFREEAVPVCSRERLRLSPVTQPSDVLGHPLLMLSSRPHAWAEWFEASGLSAQVPAPVATADHFLMLAQAAVSGTGIALIPRFLIEPELAAGTLVVPLPIPLPSAAAYHLVTPLGNKPGETSRKVRDSLIEEARAGGT